MRRITAVTLAIGAALSVAPIFAFAQDQTRMLLEMQQMRQEISELRDMIERQAFQLRQMQRAQSQSAALPGAAPGAPGVVPRTAPRVTPGAPATNQSVGVPSSLNENLASEDGFYRPQTDEQYGGVTSAASQNATSELPVPNDTATSNGSVNNVEERDLSGAAPLAKDTRVNTRPPVVERSIGVGQVNPGAGENPDTGSSFVETEQAPAIVRPVPPAPEVVEQSIGSPQSIPQSIPQGSESTSVVGTDTGIVAVPPEAASTNAPVAPPRAQGAPGQQPQSELASNAVVLSEQDYYQQGFDLLKQSRHSQAVLVFTQQVDAYPDGDFADDAYYWIAESMYVNRKLDSAKLNFKTIISRYRQSPRIPDAMLKTAYIEQEQGNEIEARILLQEVMQYHPSSNAAISAKNRLAQLK